MFGTFGSLLSFQGHTVGRHGATRKRRDAQSQSWPVSTAAEQLETRTLLTLIPGTDVNISTMATSQAETSLAINPTNPNNMILLSNGGTASNQQLYFTQDGGATWTSNPLDALDDQLAGSGGSTLRFDGVVAFDRFGTAHVSYIVQDTGLLTEAVVYGSSIDGGNTFVTRLIEPLSFTSQNQRLAIATGPDASNPNREVVMLTYQSASSLVARVAPVSGLGATGTFSSAVTLSSFLGDYARPAISPDGTFSVAWISTSGFINGPTAINFARDANGLLNGVTFTAPRAVAVSNVGWSDHIPASPDLRTNPLPQLAYDFSPGPNRGRLYMVYTEEVAENSDNLDILVMYSDNNGQSWSVPARVNDDAGINSQFLPSIAVDPITGGVFVGWYDARNDLGDGSGIDTDNIRNTDVEYYATVSTDGGLTWQPNVAMSDGDSNQARDTINLNDFGDSTSVAAYGGVGFAAWADNSNSTGNNPDLRARMDVYFDAAIFNVAPTIQFNPDITVTGVRVDEDSTTIPLNFVIADDTTDVEDITVTAVSSDPSIIPNGNLLISGVGADRSITITPALNASGTARITVIVNDGFLTRSVAFDVWVEPTPDDIPSPPDETVNTWTFDNPTATPLTDNGQTVSTIDVSALPDTYLYDVNVAIDISHTRNSDLRVVLISPQGTEVVLTSANGGGFDNVFAGTFFDDQLINSPVTDYPYEDQVVARYLVPEGALAQLVGQNPNGTWTLRVNDTVSGETGTLNDWHLELATLGSAPLLQVHSATSNQARSISDASNVDSVTIPGVTESVINLNGLDFFTYDVDVTLNLSHTSSGDLDIYLVSPSGTAILLSSGNGTSLDNIYQNSTFNDQATTPVTDVSFANNTSVGLVIPEGALSGLVGENPNGNWRLRIVDNSPTGTGTLTSWGLTVTTIFVNDAPTLGSISNPGAIPEDSGQQSINLTNISAGGGEFQPLRVTASSSNPGLIPNPTIQYTSPQGMGTLRYTPVANASGIAVITVTVEDGGYDQDLLTPEDNAFTSRSFIVVVTPTNDPPTIDPITNPSPILEDAGAQTVTLTGISSGPGETQPLILTAVSSDPLIVGHPTVSFIPGTTTATVTYQSNLDFNGTVTLTVIATDGGLDNDLSTTGDNGITTRSFVVTILKVNDPPTLNPISNPAPVIEDSPTQTISLSGITPGGQETQDLRVTASSSDPSVISDLSVSYFSPSSVGTLSYRPVPNAFGTATITVTVLDGGTDGSLATQDDNTTYQRTFVITVLEVNDPPVFGNILLGALQEDAGSQSLPIQGISAGQFETQPLAFSISSSNPALISNPTIDYTSGSTGVLHFDVTPNASGSSTLTITLMDGGLDNDLSTLADNQTFTRNLVVNVLPVNDAPTLDNLSPLVLNEDAGAQTIDLTGISEGGDEVQPVLISAVSSQPAIIPNPTVSYVSGSATGTLEFAPAANQFGTVTITVTVTDGGLDGNLATTNDNGTTVKTFTVTINSINDAPSFQPVTTPQEIEENSGQTVLAITGVSSGPHEAQMLQFSTVSSDPSIVPNPTVTYISPGTTATLRFQPVADMFGSVTVTLAVTDPGADNDFGTIGDNLTYTQEFVIVVNQFNELPTIDPISTPVAIDEDAGLQSVNLTGLSSGDGGQVFQVSASSSNTTLIPNANLLVNHSGISSTGSLAYSTAANQSGTAAITVTVMDGGTDNDLTTLNDNKSQSTTFNVVVEPVNDLPTLTSLGDSYDLSEDAGLQVINLSGITAGGGESQPLRVTVESLNPQLIPSPTITYSSPSATGELRFAPLANMSGSATLRLRVEDGGADGDLSTVDDNAFITQDLIVNVAAINDLPTINAVSTPYTIDEDSSSSTLSLTGITAGGGESQALTITAVSDNPALIADPTIDYVQGQATAQLTLAPLPNQSGTANITISVEDSQGGITTRTLTVIVSPNNDLPTIDDLGEELTIDEDAGEQTINLSGILAGPGEAGQVFNITVTSSDPALIPDPTLIYTPGESTGAIKFQPLANQHGQVTLTIEIVDGGLDNDLSTTGDNSVRTISLVVNVTSQPETPVLTINSGTLIAPGGRPAKIAADAQLTDDDSDSFNGGNIHARLTEGAQTGDQLKLTAFRTPAGRIRATRKGVLKAGRNVIGTVSGGRGAIPLQIQFTAAISAEGVEAILRNIVFSGISSQPGLRTVSVSVTDNTNLTSNVETRLIALT